MAKTVRDVIDIATAEWKHWGNSTWNLSTDASSIGHRDDEIAYADYVIANYNAAGGGSPTRNEIRDDKYYWSAVGISYVFKKAEFSKTEFPFSQAHSTWIRKFVAARKDGDASALYHAFRLHEAAPDVGDMVGYTYAKTTFEKAQAYYDKTGPYPSHTDIVVAKRPDEIDVIGFNVLDSVTKKTIPLDADGLIADTSHKWFVVLKRNTLA